MPKLNDNFPILNQVISFYTNFEDKEIKKLENALGWLTEDVRRNPSKSERFSWKRLEKIRTKLKKIKSLCSESIIELKTIYK